MKFTILLVAALASLGRSAGPVAKPKEVDTHRVFTQRDGNACKIVNGKTVNCRAGPGMQYDAVATVSEGSLWFFTCVKSGECITIDGNVNWYVQVLLDETSCQLTCVKRLGPTLLP